MSQQLFRAPSGDLAGTHVVTIGNFGGVHRGHQFLLQQVVERAAGLGCRSAVVTFDPLPVQVLRPGRPAQRLTTTDDRVELIRALSIDRVEVVRFTTDVASLSPQAFVDELVGALHPVLVVVGADFVFGHQRAGTPEVLRELGQTRGFDVEVVERLATGGEEISSTRIREHLAAGDVRGAERLLGRPYSVHGLVVHGNKRGRLLGFPTANLRLDEGILLPADGIYATMALIEGRGSLWPSMSYVGTRPTFDEHERVLEVNLLNFSGDLYDQILGVVFVDAVRPDQRFESADALVEQMHRDRKQTQHRLGDLGEDWPGEPLRSVLWREERAMPGGE